MQGRLRSAATEEEGAGGAEGESWRPLKQRTLETAVPERGVSYLLEIVVMHSDN